MTDDRALPEASRAMSRLVKVRESLTIELKLRELVRLRVVQ